MKLYSPGPVTNEVQVSRIISHSSDRGQGQFRSAMRRKQKALQWHDHPRFSIELITSKLECKSEDVQIMLHQWAATVKPLRKIKNRQFEWFLGN
jgi:hypothetical protein